jgi:DNA-directed RNA polymerase subunit RPC12/RpoP
MACSKCGREINQDFFPFGTQFCPYCGDRIGTTEPFEPIPFCRYCGQRLLTEVTFCPQCGKNILAEPVAPPVVEVVQPPPYAPPPIRQPVSMSEPVVDTFRESARTRPSRQAPPPPCPPTVKRTRPNIFQPVNNLFSRRGRLTKLYASWSENDELPAEEIPSPEELRKLTRQPDNPVRSPLPVRLIVLACLIFIVVFVCIGILLKSSM